MSRCYEPREIGTVVELPPDDPRRRHLDDCPRCRALALAYEEFLHPADDRTFELAAADAELRRRLTAVMAQDEHAQRRAWPRRPVRPAWGALAAALALVAIGLVAGDVSRWRDGRLPTGEGVVRGDEVEPGLVLEVREGDLLVTWTRHDTDERVLLVGFDEHMHVIGRRETKADTLQIGAQETLAKAAFFQLVHLAGTDTLARSAIVAPGPAGD